jgi:hypothetical protein
MLLLFVLIFSNDDPDTEQRHLGGLTPCLRYPCFADMYDNPLLSYKKLAGNRSIVERLRDYEY